MKLPGSNPWEAFDFFCIRVTKVCTNCCASLKSSFYKNVSNYLGLPRMPYSFARSQSGCYMEKRFAGPGMARSWNTSSKQHTPSVASLTQCKCKFEITTHQPHIHWSQLHISLNLANQRFSPSITCQKCTNSEYPLTKKSCSKQDLSRIAPAIQARHAHGVHNARRTTLYTDCRAHRQKAPTVCMH